MRAALLQITSSDDPDANRRMLAERIRAAAADGADFVFTPEVSNCVSASRTRQNEVLRPEAEDPTLADLRDLAAGLGIWINIGSLALKTDDPQGRFANRSFVLDDTGAIAGRYDKIHMFDVQISETETYRESDGYRPGDSLTLVPTPFGKIGLSICYDIRFPHIFRAMAKSGADILTAPSAFSPVSGAAHWESLLRARAIENTCFVLAAAQTGRHPATRGRQRETYGHSMAVDPWGNILAQMNTIPDTVLVNVELSEVAEARKKIPSLGHDTEFAGP